MAVVRSWLDEFTNEIHNDQFLGFDAEMAARIKEMVEKHCPFKQDTAYVPLSFTRRWRAIQNPMRADSTFVCDGPDRRYGTGEPRLPHTAVPMGMDRYISNSIVHAHNAEIDKLTSVLESLRMRHHHCMNDEFLCCNACDVCTPETRKSLRLPSRPCDCGADEHNARIDAVLKETK